MPNKHTSQTRSNTLKQETEILAHGKHHKHEQSTDKKYHHYLQMILHDLSTEWKNLQVSTCEHSIPQAGETSTRPKYTKTVVQMRRARSLPVGHHAHPPQYCIAYALSSSIPIHIAWFIRHRDFRCRHAYVLQRKVDLCGTAEES